MKYIEIDYGQIEARVLGMASKDKKFCHALHNDLDVHMDWAKRLAKEHPDVLRLHGGRDGPLDLKTWRSIVKNKWTFPLFYGAGVNTVSRGTQIPADIIEDIIPDFWEEFPGVKEWQIWVTDFYKKHGYVEGLTGTRTYAPLKYNKIINSPIQGTAADICVWSHTKICKQARRREWDALTPVNNVHDALWWHCNDDEVDEIVELAVAVMLSAVDRFEFINVPLTVEVEVGETLYDMKKQGTFSSATH